MLRSVPSTTPRSQVNSISHSHKNTSINNNHEHNNYNYNNNNRFLNSLPQNRSLYTWQKAPKPDSKKPLPWKKDTVRVSPTQKLRTWVYNPFGHSKRPPQPIIGIPDNLWGSGKIFASAARHSNYPYGFVGMDLRGRGGSVSEQPISASKMMKHHVHDYLKVLEHYQLVRAYVVAHGYGAYVAYKIAELYPEKISGFVLVDSGFPQDEATKDGDQSRGFQVLSAKHLEGEFSSPGEIIEASGMPPKKPKDLSADEMAFFRETVEKKSNGKYVVKSNKTLAEKEFQELSSKLPRVKDLWKIRHPVGLVTASKNGVISASDAQVMRDTLYTVGSVDVDAAHHNALLLDMQHAEEVAAQMDNLTSLFDYQQRVIRSFDDVKKQVSREQTQN
eukprot:gb/GECH01000108.1/.p1 GENE.gb/GECH01000108.1/~~gb/GECH01000108.1/.p1  ORF type:complete len:388 (+),score=81.25 gb/GECH01000108.1/:1-1164(+)